MTILKALILENFLELAEAQNYPALAEALNYRGLVPNPNPQGQVPAQLSLDALRPLLSNAEKQWILQAETLNTLLGAAFADSNIDDAEVDLVLDQFVDRPTGDKPLLVALRDLVERGQGETLMRLCGVLRDLGKISADTHTAIAASLAATVPDPTWQPEIRGTSLAAANGFGTVTARQVREALSE